MLSNYRHRPYLDSSTACTIATFIVHSKLDYCNSHYYMYKLPKSQLFRRQQIQNSLARTVIKAPISPVISFPSYALSTGSESLNASNTSSSHFTYLQSSHNYPTCIPSYANFHSTSSQYSLFIRRYSCSATFIILS